MGILAGTGVAKFNDFNQKELVRQAALELENSLVMIRNKAMVGEKVCGEAGCGGDATTCAGSEPLTGWSVKFNLDTNCWGRNGKCDNECKYSSLASQDVYTSCNKGSVCSGNCWSTNGTGCDYSGCQYSSIAQYTVYPSCNSSVCAQKDCWSTGGGQCNSDCQFTSANVKTVYPDCTSQSCATYKWKGNPPIYSNESWNCTHNSYRELWSKEGCKGNIVGLYYSFVGGRCSPDGTGNCYTLVERKLDSPVRYRSWKEFPGGKCTSEWWMKNMGTNYLYDFFPCTWSCISGCGQNKYEVSGSLQVKWQGAGSCSNNGTGLCRALTNKKTYYTAGADCGGSGCSSGDYYDDKGYCFWLSASYSYSVGGTPFQAYQGGGSCSGSKTCYKLTDGGSYYTGSSSCGGYNCSGAGTYFKSSQSCQFLDAVYNYTASNKVTKLKGTGFCNSDGSGDCYKMLGSSTSYYTKDGDCGSKCPSDSFYDSSLKCEFYGEIGAPNTAYQIRGVCGENVFNFKNFKLPGNGKVTISYSPEEVVFKPVPAFGVDKPGDICVSGFGKYYKINISDTGVVKGVGFVETCP